VNSLFYNVLGYVWQYVSNPKAIMAISGFVALMAMYNVIPAKIFWLLIICYVFGLMLWGIYLLIVRRRHAAQGEALADAIAHDTQCRIWQTKKQR
jgi:type VI secretion system protein ImpL